MQRDIRISVPCVSGQVNKLHFEVDTMINLFLPYRCLMNASLCVLSTLTKHFSFFTMLAQCLTCSSVQAKMYLCVICTYQAL